jgi:proline dehydrogenase
LISPPAILARRFVAGETAEEAVAAGRRLHDRGIKATFDLLGEDVLDEDAARRSAEANKDLLRRIPPEVDRNISIKLTMMGLDIATDFCLALTAGILDVAREMGGFVRIDMEGSKHTQRTIDAFRSLRRRYDNVGIVLQAYLHRTEDDVKEAVARGDRVRICKGAYKEPASIAWTDMDDIRASYRRCARLLLEKGNYPAIATHDESLVQDALAFARERGIDSARYEFQMLYGLRPRRWDGLVRAGHNVRVYVPYGHHWFPYFYRRLRERKENVFFVLRSLLGG